MRNLFISITLFAAIGITSCKTSGSQSIEEAPVFDLEGNVNVEVSNPISVRDLTYTPLSDDVQEAFFKSANIIDVVGDTVLLFEDNSHASRLIMFNRKDGKYLGQINHQGQGPGEYTSILGAFVDGITQTVMLPDFFSPKVNVYSLSADSLIGTIDREYVQSGIEPIGNVESCINVAVPTEEGMKIMQYDRNYVLTDSIHLPGFEGGNFSTVWANAGTEGVFMGGDTIFALQPGILKPISIADRGKFTITPEIDQKIIMEILDSGESEIEILKPYMLIRNIRFTDNKMLLTTMHNAKKNSDLYDMSTGKLIYRNTYDALEKPSSIVIEDENHKPLQIESLFAKNGIWYALVSEDFVAESADTNSEDANCALVSFRF
ncbi:MAG: 6-bladed beta-propeller [Muribaculaceae bacterium]|nr:6-bladed beta-propeller [Muribaculaceae bacterium]